MTELERPIKQLLREPRVARASIDALWSRIDAARTQQMLVRPLRNSTAAPRVRVLGFAGALGAVFALAALTVIYVVPRAVDAWSSAKSTDTPLSRENGEMLHVLDTSGTGAAFDVALSDGSHIHLDPGAKLITTRSDGRQFRAAVERGKVLFDVKPGGPRRWIIDAGDTWATVIGTRFSIARDAGDVTGQVTVAVEHGRVEVRGTRVPEGLQALGRGERLVVAPPSAASAAPDVQRAAPAGAPELLEPEPAGTPANDRANTERRPNPPSAPVRAHAISADQRLKTSDAARASGDYRRAARELQRFLADYPGDARAAIVALTLGRLQLDQLESPKAAAVSFARADRLGLPEAVAEEGAARLVEAYAYSGEKELARAAAARYVRRFPGGARRANVAAWTDPD
jgi:transmembrane sensor